MISLCVNSVKSSEKTETPLLTKAFILPKLFNVFSHLTTSFSVFAEHKLIYFEVSTNQVYPCQTFLRTNSLQPAGLTLVISQLGNSYLCGLEAIPGYQPLPPLLILLASGEVRVFVYSLNKTDIAIIWWFKKKTNV